MTGIAILQTAQCSLFRDIAKSKITSRGISFQNWADLLVRKVSTVWDLMRKRNYVYAASPIFLMDFMKPGPTKPLAVRLIVGVIGGLFVAIVVFAVAWILVLNLLIGEGVSPVLRTLGLIGLIVLPLLAGWSSFRASMKQ